MQPIRMYIYLFLLTWLLLLFIFCQKLYRQRILSPCKCGSADLCTRKRYTPAIHNSPVRQQDGDNSNERPTDKQSNHWPFVALPYPETQPPHSSQLLLFSLRTIPPPLRPETVPLPPFDPYTPCGGLTILTSIGERQHKDHKDDQSLNATSATD